MPSILQLRRTVGKTGAPTTTTHEEGEVALAFPNAAGTNTAAEFWAFDGTAWAQVDGTISGLDDLSDVDVTTTAPTDNQALVYDGPNTTWKPETVWADGALVSDWQLKAQTVTDDATVNLNAGHLIDWTLTANGTLTFQGAGNNLAMTVILHSGGFTPTFVMTGKTVHAPDSADLTANANYWISVLVVGSDLYWSERKMA